MGGATAMEDLEYLAPELRSRSLSDREIVLNYADTLEAITLLIDQQVAIVCWEGWLRYSDGRKGHSGLFQGTYGINRETGETWGDYVDRAAAFCKETVGKSFRLWQQAPEPTGAELFFCLSLASEEG